MVWSKGSSVYYLRSHFPAERGMTLEEYDMCLPGDYRNLALLVALECAAELTL